MSALVIMLSLLINMGKIITGIHGLESFTNWLRVMENAFYLIDWKPSLKKMSGFCMSLAEILVKSSLKEYQIQDMYHKLLS